MLTNVKLRNIKCFDTLDINLSRLNVLTGINGSGKSTFIQSILLAQQSANSTALNLNGALVEIGSYFDLFHSSTEEDDAYIAIQVEKDRYRWGYDEYVEDKTSILSLPYLNGTNFSGFGQFLYISAERWGPRNNVPLNMTVQNKNWLGKHGEYTIPVLGTLRSRALSGQKEKEDVLAENDPRKHENSSGNLIYNNIEKWMGEVSPNVKIDVDVVTEGVTSFTSFSFGGSRKYKASNVGFGLSYTLGIVTALLIAKAGALVVIENPEAHLHPAGQTAIGLLIARAAQAGVQVVVETHSDHVLDGIRIAVKQGLIPAEDVMCAFFKREVEGYSDYILPQMSSDGRLDQWPTGFFDQNMLNLAKLNSP